MHIEFRVCEGEALKHLRVNGSHHIGIDGAEATRLAGELRVKVVMVFLAFLQR